MMRTQNGFTLIELMIVIAIVGIIAAVVRDAGYGVKQQCRNGYVWDVLSNRQVLGVNGGGVACDDKTGGVK